MNVTVTPKGKAIWLVSQFYEVVKNKYPSTIGVPLSKQCALIAVDEIIENEKIDNLEDNNLSYWQEVKQELLKL
jgi:hypothetical protein